MPTSKYVSVSLVFALKKYIHFESDDIFLTFNYTDTLQQLYDVLDAQVLHIHGSNAQEKILGHNEQYYELRLSNITQEDFENGIEEDWRIEEAKEILNSIPTLFYKNSKSIIESNRTFFAKYSSNKYSVSYYTWETVSKLFEFLI